MSDSYNNREPSNSRFSRSRGDNPNNFRGNREGGFRIRLSDNEMKAVRSIQETFNLRSTVAVLGFALRTLAQLINEGKLKDFIEEYQSSNSNPRENNRSNNRRDYNDEPRKGSLNKKTKANPFERPIKAEVISQNSESSAEEEELLSQDKVSLNQITEK